MLGLRWMCMHIYEWTWSKGLLISKKRKKMKICVRSQWRVVLLWYHIFSRSSIQRGRHTQLCIITSLKWIIQICSTFTDGFVKLLSTHPIHIVVRGNFPFIKVEYPLKVHRHTCIHVWWYFTLGFRVKLCHFVQLFILFFRAVSGSKSAKYLCRIHAQ